MNVQGSRSGALFGRRWRKGHIVADFLLVVRHLPLPVVNLVELPQHAKEVRLAMRKVPGSDQESVAQRRQTQMLFVQDLLRANQFLVEALQRQFRRKHGVLHVEQPVVSGGYSARFGALDWVI